MMTFTLDPTSIFVGIVLCLAAEGLLFVGVVDVVAAGRAMRKPPTHPPTPTLVR